jgi:HEPN domain-containing protein
MPGTFSQAVQTLLEKVSLYAVGARYPGTEISVSNAQAEAAVKTASEISKFAEEVLEKGSG